MALTTLDQSLKVQLNKISNPGNLADMLRSINIGDVLRADRVVLRNKSISTTADPYNTISGTITYSPPDDARGMTGVYAYAKVGSGTAALLTYDGVTGSAPAAGHWAITPNGALAFATADAWTSVDIVYAPEKVDVIELTLPVVSDLATLPTALVNGGASTLIEAESLVGGVTGKFTIIVPASGKPATTKQASFNLAKAGVLFKASDAVTSCRLKIGVPCAVDVDALLEALTNYV